ncbi:hypothetical protein ACQEVF_19360 [Nonomuraea polychroma]|uniref:hypothetical protein n=1 Tax=Nonomuraea polychroma TaxID=46176 RepID=UPI003D912056
MGGPATPHVLAALLMTIVLAAVLPVARDAYLPSVVGAGHLVPANALLSLLPLVVYLGVGWRASALDGNELGLLAMITAVMVVTARCHRHSEALRDFTEGF